MFEHLAFLAAGAALLYTGFCWGKQVITVRVDKQPHTDGPFTDYDLRRGRVTKVKWGDNV